MKKNFWVLLVLVMVSVAFYGWARAQDSSPATPQIGWEERQQFRNDTEPMRKSLWEKKAKLRNLLAEPESNPTEIGELQKEIVQLGEEIRGKAQDAGFQCPRGGMGRGAGFGYGMGDGRGMRQRCWWR